MSATKPQPPSADAAASGPPQPFAIVRLAAAIRSNIDRIALAEQRASGQLPVATRHQCDQALRFIAHYAAHNAGGPIDARPYVSVSAGDASPAPFELAGHVGRSLFELFAGVAVHLRVGHAVSVRLDADRAYLKELAILGDCCQTTVDRTFAAMRSFGATQIVFDSGDAAAALAELAIAHHDRSAPWRIRVCWLQETLRDQFADRAARCDDAPHGELAATVGRLGGILMRSGDQLLVADVPLPLWRSSAALSGHESVVLVQFFRTCRELIGLLRQQPADSTHSLSVWTESSSLTLELAAALPDALNIWQNCSGLLDPSVPFTFDDVVYGSELALCQTAIGRPSAAPALRFGQLNAAFAAELAVDGGDYSSMRLLKRVAFMTNGRRRTATNPDAVADWVVQAKDPLKRRLIANVLFNQFQTLVVPYGTIFAN